jgi:hypothetical protein
VVYEVPFLPLWNSHRGLSSCCAIGIGFPQRPGGYLHTDHVTSCIVSFGGVGHLVKAWSYRIFFSASSIPRDHFTMGSYHVWLPLARLTLLSSREVCRAFYAMQL